MIAALLLAVCRVWPAGAAKTTRPTGGVGIRARDALRDELRGPLRLGAGDRELRGERALEGERPGRRAGRRRAASRPGRCDGGGRRTRRDGGAAWPWESSSEAEISKSRASPLKPTTHGRANLHVIATSQDHASSCMVASVTTRPTVETTPACASARTAETQRAIVRAAAELILEEGYAAATIPRIAARADVAPRTVSTWFPAKDDILFDEIDEAVARATRHLRSGTGDTVDRLQAVAGRRVEPGAPRPRDLPPPRSRDRPGPRAAGPRPPPPRPAAGRGRRRGRARRRRRAGRRRRTGLHRRCHGLPLRAPRPRSGAARRRRCPTHRRASPSCGPASPRCRPAPDATTEGDGRSTVRIAPHLGYPFRSFGTTVGREADGPRSRHWGTGSHSPA